MLNKRRTFDRLILTSSLVDIVFLEITSLVSLLSCQTVTTTSCSCWVTLTSVCSRQALFPLTILFPRKQETDVRVRKTASKPSQSTIHFKNCVNESDASGYSKQGFVASGNVYREECLNSIKEAAVIVGIQALAEQGCWQNVIPFVEQAYHQIGACPAKVIHMCILLHAHIREYMLCHSLVNTWLDANSHRSSPDAAVTVRLYVQNVLRPLGAFNLIPQVVDSCPALSSTEREALLSPHSTPPKTTYERQNDPSEPCNNLPSSDAEPTAGKTRTAKSQDSGILASYVDLARQLLRKAARKGWCRQMLLATSAALW
ncbi:uncharacterized protein LOC112571848 isoform X2 [Pomacea canaliculata]|uniref:uncharacterized protein LOC112571848 isoform X2 n=1 Tax=Pomacea canaliculata TaxID=400727 RepID=UPI000D7264B9|nr:uncharacterized protein LOC112571848 isoform X2 [Pomacea canaliculata]